MSTPPPDPAVSVTTYWQTVDGALITATATSAVEVPADATELTAEEFAQATADAQAAHDAAKSDLIGQAQQAAWAANQVKLTDRDALVALGLDEASANRITGYDPDMVDPSP